MLAFVRVGRGTMLEAGRSRGSIPDEVIRFSFNLPNPSSRTMALGPTHPELTASKSNGSQVHFELVTRYLLYSV
jgi:hypothetical protein